MGNKTRIIMVSLGMSFWYQYLILKLSIIWLKKKPFQQFLKEIKFIGFIYTKVWYTGSSTLHSDLIQ